LLLCSLQRVLLRQSAEVFAWVGAAVLLMLMVLVVRNLAGEARARPSNYINHILLGLIRTTTGPLPNGQHDTQQAQQEQ